MRFIRFFFRAGIAALLFAGLSGCSLQHLAADRLGDALSGGGTVFAADDDPELIREATPFSLKLMESVLAERPDHAALLTATARGYTQYAYAWLQQDADEIEERDLPGAFRLRERARKLYRRARDYGLRALDVAHPGFSARLRTAPAAALAELGKDDVAALFWSGAAWGAWIALSTDNPDAVADLPVLRALFARALALDEGFDAGALHGVMISLAMSQPGGADLAAARRHFSRAVDLSQNHQAAPYVALAEVVGNRREFETLLGAALNIDADAAPQWRLANLLMQRRARWLLGRADQIFTE